MGLEMAEHTHDRLCPFRDPRELWLPTDVDACTVGFEVGKKTQRATGRIKNIVGNADYGIGSGAGEQIDLGCR